MNIATKQELLEDKYKNIYTGLQKASLARHKFTVLYVGIE